MVVRNEKRKRKYFGTRRWGAGNIKNARGAGDRGGVGKAGARKHNFTHMTAKEPWLIKRKGFTKWRQNKLETKSLSDISRMESKDGTISLVNTKVLSNGSITKPLKIKASAFSKKAIEKIQKAGGEAISSAKTD